MKDRASLRYPPFGELIVVEASDAPDWAAEWMRDRIAALVLGPADVGGRTRWLLQGEDLVRPG